MSEANMIGVVTFDDPDAIVEFWHSDENSPFMTIRCSYLDITEELVLVYSMDYKEPICIIKEYGWWREI